jgi:GcrA cell cycle regulator
MSNFDWTNTALARLREIVDSGASTSTAARILSAEFGHHLTRNAVAGRANRLGMFFKSTSRPANRPASVAPAKRAKPKKAASAPAPTPIAPTLAELAEPAEVGIPTTGRVALLDLEVGMCRWPIGHPREAGFGFCGARATGAVYCGYHAQIAYTTAAEAKRAAAEWRQAHSKAASAA